MKKIKKIQFDFRTSISIFQTLSVIINTKRRYEMTQRERFYFWISSIEHHFAMTYLKQSYSYSCACWLKWTLNKLLCMNNTSLFWQTYFSLSLSLSLSLPLTLSLSPTNFSLNSSSLFFFLYSLRRLTVLIDRNTWFSMDKNNITQKRFTDSLIH